MIKKILNVIFIIAILGTTLIFITGCGNNKDSKEEKVKIVTENYSEGKLEYTFDDENKTAVVTGIKGSIKFDEKKEITEIIIPNTVVKDNTNYKVSSIRAGSYSSSAFSGLQNLNSIVLPSDFTLPQYAFSYCVSLQKITLPNGITKIPTGTFYYCKNLSDISIPNTVNEIGNSVFINCNKLETVSFPDSITKIGQQTFHECESLKSVKLPNNLTSLGYETFGYCPNLESVELPNGLKEIPSSTFTECGNLKEINIPNSVTKIGGAAFYKCTSLTDISIPDNVTEIGGVAFAECTSLKSITIPSSVEKIEARVFTRCKDLTIYVKGKKEAPKGWDTAWNDLYGAGSTEKVKTVWDN